MDLLPHQAAFGARSDLQKFGSNARLLFALETRFRLEDVHTVAANALTDGSNDKKCDLVFLDREREQIVIAQGYESTKAGNVEAPGNKASDLNTAVGWLFSRALNELPPGLQPAAEEIRTALESGEVTSIQVWYVHNLPESKNVGDELKTVENALLNVINSRFSDAEVEEFVAIEVGRNTLEEWYQALQAPILVSEQIDVEIDGFYEVRGDNWQAAVTAVPAKWLHDLYAKHDSHLFSANVRDYLGSRKSTQNVNNGIKTTATKQPGQFWVFNNGITALVNDYTTDSIDDGKRTRLTLNGVSIVNGAQTTGSLGSLDNMPSTTALVQARFVKCSDKDTIQSIIQFNNTQNAVKATDFRSNDAVQRRLREEFGSMPQAKYLGGRRGGADDTIKRPPNILPTDTCSQALAAFHRDPALAYNRKSQIWQNDALYSKFFSDATRADHVVMCYSLLRAVEAHKQSLLDKQNSSSQLTSQETEQLAFLRRRGATFLLAAAIAACLEVLLGRAVPNLFRLSFGTKTAPETAKIHWRPIVEATLPFCNVLVSAAEGGMKNQETVKNALADFQRMVAATKSGNEKIFSEFAACVVEYSG